MAAINETKGQGLMNIKLTSSEYPELSVEGKQGQRVNLRKELNKKIRERRRKSGSVSGQMSPSKKKVKARDIEDVPQTITGAQGAEPTGYPSSTMPSPIKKKKKLTAAQKQKEGRKGTVKQSLIPDHLKNCQPPQE